MMNMFGGGSPSYVATMPMALLGTQMATTTMTIGKITLLSI